ncbi:uncharacterized protein LOC128133054 [Lactuca sativa]|uniref:uncharacterized protein LOC128133054 n=1 Tax=Lactuca sativa TaxID=4236 RepID=UPI0022AF34CF|nr:uncharacterized protein LOC128133054 [Lactuca sativa]
MEDYVNNPANMHDFSLMNTKAFANLKGSGGNIWEVFEVLDDARRATNNVQLERRVCSCGKWQKSGIPCGHAIACLRTRTSESIQRMVEYKFTNYVYRVAYGSELVNGIPSYEHWEIPNETVVLLPPSMQ